MTSSPDSQARNELAAELNRIDDDVTYYALTLTASPDGQFQRVTQTQFVGSGAKLMWEMRTASPVNAVNMRYLWKKLGQPSVVVNSKRSLMFFMRAGGNAVIAEAVFRQWFGNLLDPVECVPSRVGEGVRAVASATPAELQHAPSRNMRMEVLKRDQFRCKACGQRPAEDPNIVLHVHHVRPWGQGGLTGMHNLVTLCHTCHTGLDPHFEWQLLTMVPDGVVAPMTELEDELKTFAEGVRRYREIVAAQLRELDDETTA